MKNSSARNSQNKKMIFSATITKGVLKFNRTKFMEQLGKLKDGRFWIKIERIRAKRSDQQNRWYWGVVLATISEHTGHTPNELHEIYKRMFLPAETIPYRDKKIKVANTTTKLDKGEFSEYIERVRAEAATMGVTIPDPDTMNPY